MKLRVKHYLSDHWTVQRLWLGLFWLSVTKTIVFERDRFISSRYAPLLFGSFDAAEREAVRLLVPGAMERHILDQDELWLAAKQRFKTYRSERRRIKVIQS